MKRQGIDKLPILFPNQIICPADSVMEQAQSTRISDGYCSLFSWISGTGDIIFRYLFPLQQCRVAFISLQVNYGSVRKEFMTSGLSCVALKEILCVSIHRKLSLFDTEATFSHVAERTIPLLFFSWSLPLSLLFVCIILLERHNKTSFNAFVSHTELDFYKHKYFTRCLLILI